MKAEIEISSVWYNHSLMDFFFRNQAEETMEGLINRAVGNTQSVLDAIEDYANDNNLYIDAIEEMFYNDTVEELADEFGVELEVEDDDDRSEMPWDYGKHFD